MRPKKTLLRSGPQPYRNNRTVRRIILQQEANEPAEKEVVYPLKLHLKKGEPQLLWSGFARVTLGASYEGLENATLYFYFGSQEHRIDMWADRRQTITVRGRTYWMDLLDNDDESATISISKFTR